IHLENSGKVERVGATLVDKFADVIRNSQFLNRSGKMELNLLLKPAHLGHVTIKMTQVDGEMMVKMLVSSQAAKDMLEQNMHQLRHLFQPHQISVERNEEVSDEEFYFDEQEEQQDDENQQTTEDDYQDDHNQNEDTQVLDFEAIMEQLGEEVTLKMSKTINSDIYLSNQEQNRAPSPDLGKDEFLKILMTQLQNQDPLDPMDDKDFIAQMAIFSSLEQLMNMSGTMDNIVRSQTVSPVIQNSHLIGKEVSYIDENGKVKTSEVIAVSQKNGEPVLELSNDDKIYAGIVEKIGEPGEVDDVDDGESDDDVIGDPDEGDSDDDVVGDADE